MTFVSKLFGGLGGYHQPPLPPGKSATLTPEKGRAKNSILATNEIKNGPERTKNGPKGAESRLCWRKTFGVFGGAFPRQFFLKGLKKFEIYKYWWMYSLDIDISIDGN